MEYKILRSFRKYMGPKVKYNYLLVSIPDNFDECYECEIMENKINGKVWYVETNSNYEVIYVYSLAGD